MTSVIIYHRNCPDGFGAAWWLGRHVGEHIKFAANWNDEPPVDLCEAREVYVVDFCYPPDDLERLAASAVKVDIFDHHQTSLGWAEEYHARHPETSTLRDSLGGHWMLTGSGDTSVDIVIDEDQSGAGLIARLAGAKWGTTVPSFLYSIEDRDLWRFDLPDTKNVFAAVTSRPYTDEAWDDMLAIERAYQSYSDDGASLSLEGEAINRYRDQLIEQVAATSFTLALGDLHVPCATSPYAIGSDVAGLLAERSTDGIGAYAILHSDHVQVGLRSRGNGPDVARIAERWGGGGHPHASGLKMSWGEFFG